MARIFLLRHGETAANSQLRYQGQLDTPLNRKGLEQARQLATELKKTRFIRIYSSDLQRALQTAETIAKAQRLPLIQVPELRERAFGAWEDMTFQEIKTRYRDIYETWLKTPEAKIPEAEDFQRFKERVLKGLSQILKTLAKDENIAVVAHGGPNRIILHHFLGLPPEKSFWKLKQDNACINVIEIMPGYQMISLLNYHSDNLRKSSIKY